MKVTEKNQMNEETKSNNLPALHIKRQVLTCGCSALKGGMPTISSNNMTPTDHQSAVAPGNRKRKEIG